MEYYDPKTYVHLCKKPVDLNEKLTDREKLWLKYGKQFSSQELEEICKKNAYLEKRTEEMKRSRRDKNTFENHWGKKSFFRPRSDPRKMNDLNLDCEPGHLKTKIPGHVFLQDNCGSNIETVRTREIRRNLFGDKNADVANEDKDRLKIGGEDFNLDKLSLIEKSKRVSAKLGKTSEDNNLIEDEICKAPYEDRRLDKEIRRPIVPVDQRNRFIVEDECKNVNKTLDEFIENERLAERPQKDHVGKEHRGISEVICENQFTEKKLKALIDEKNLEENKEGEKNENIENHNCPQYDAQFLLDNFHQIRESAGVCLKNVLDDIPSNIPPKRIPKSYKMSDRYAQMRKRKALCTRTGCKYPTEADIFCCGGGKAKVCTRRITNRNYEKLWRNNMAKKTELHEVDIRKYLNTGKYMNPKDRASFENLIQSHNFEEPTLLDEVPFEMQKKICLAECIEESSRSANGPTSITAKELMEKDLERLRRKTYDELWNKVTKNDDNLGDIKNRIDLCRRYRKAICNEVIKR
ncbi:hypothetical protein SNEBB_011212 [Seison nebaliae]|nr:hypothetical protein SNEBB_011212 [Seison nebaliae]